MKYRSTLRVMIVGLFVFKCLTVSAPVAEINI